MIDVKACEQLMARLNQHQVVPAVELKVALGEEHWTDYKLRRAWVRGQRERAKIASCKLGQYVKALRIADLRQAQADRMRVRTGKLMPRGKRPYDLYEQALLRLSELIEVNPSLAEYLDRRFSPHSWDGGSDISPDKECVPRLWFHAENALPPIAEREIKTVRQLKMEALQRAIDAQLLIDQVLKKPNSKPLRRRKTL
jgi:hypothetical protein